MEKSKYPRLTGGVLFSILLNCCNDNLGARQKWEGKSKNLHEAIVFKKLIETLGVQTAIPLDNPNDNQGHNKAISAAKIISGYKNCHHDGSKKYFPLNDGNFQFQIKNNYLNKRKDCLDNMENFINECFERSKEIETRIAFSFIQGLISEDDAFKEVRSKFLVNNIPLTSYLLDLLFFVLTNVKTNKQDMDSAMKFDCSAEPFKNRFESITITFGFNESTIVESEFKGTGDQEETIYGEDIKEDNFDEEQFKFDFENKPVINFFFGGTNNTNIGHVENLTINKGKKDE